MGSDDCVNKTKWYEGLEEQFTTCMEKGSDDCVKKTKWYEGLAEQFTNCMEKGNGVYEIRRNVGQKKERQYFFCLLNYKVVSGKTKNAVRVSYPLPLYSSYRYAV